MLNFSGLIPNQDSARELGSSRDSLLRSPSLFQSPTTEKQNLDMIRKTLSHMKCSDASIYELADFIQEKNLTQDSLVSELQKTMNTPLYRYITSKFHRNLSLDKRHLYQSALICALECQFPNENTEIIKEVKNQSDFKDKINLYLIRDKLSSLEGESEQSIHAFADFIREKELTRESIVSELDQTINPSENSRVSFKFMKKLSVGQKKAYQCALLCALGVQFPLYGTHVTVNVKNQPDFSVFNDYIGLYIIYEKLNSINCVTDRTMYELATMIQMKRLTQESLLRELEKTLNPGCDLSEEKNNVYQSALVCALEVQFPNENTEIINEVKNQSNFKDKINLYLIRDKLSTIEVESEQSIHAFADFIREKELACESIKSELDQTINPNKNSRVSSKFIKNLSGDQKTVYQCALLCALEFQFPDEELNYLELITTKKYGRFLI